MALHIREIKYPGTFLQPDVPHKAESLLSLLESHLADACVALGWFQDARAALQAEVAAKLSNPRKDLEQVREIEQALEREIPQDLGHEERWTARAAISDEARLRVARARWAAGKPPSAFVYQAPFIHARTFLFAADGFLKALEALSEELRSSESLKACLRQLRDDLPQLRDVRNTAHHPEDRVRGLGKHGKSFTLSPIATRAIVAPTGGVLVTSSLEGDRYGCTLADGRFGQVEVNERSLDALAGAMQAAINGLPWSGPPRSWPST